MTHPESPPDEHPARANIPITLAVTNPRFVMAVLR